MDTTTSLIVIGFISGVTQAIKLQFPSLSKLSPVFAVLIGAGLGYVGFQDMTSYIDGMLYGGAAAGFYALGSAYTKTSKVVL
jgi:predicted tellurium resistance membrane protein TerC